MSQINEARPASRYGFGPARDARQTALEYFRAETPLDFADKTRLIIAVSSAIIAVFTVCAALYFARPIFVPIMTAFVLSVLLAPATEWLRRRGVPAALRAMVVVLAAFSLFATAVYLAVQPGADWLERFPAIMEDARDKLIGMREAVDKVQDVSEKVSELTDMGNQDRAVTVQGPDLGESLITSARTIIVQTIFTAVLTFFFLAARTDLRRKLTLMRTSFAGMRQSARMMQTIEEQVGHYMFTMLIINIGLGVATALAMWALGLPSPIIWGALAAILNFIPYLGPIAMTALLGISGVVNFDTIPGMLAAPAIYVILNFIESNLVTPTLIGVRLTISPLTVILNVSFWTWLWGPAGAVISIPLLVIFKTICDHSTFLRPVGMLIGDPDTFRPVKSNLRSSKALG